MLFYLTFSNLSILYDYTQLRNQTGWWNPTFPSQDYWKYKNVNLLGGKHSNNLFHSFF